MKAGEVAEGGDFVIDPGDMFQGVLLISGKDLLWIEMLIRNDTPLFQEQLFSQGVARQEQNAFRGNLGQSLKFRRVGAPIGDKCQ